MAATATVESSWDIGGNYKAYVGTIAFDDSYPTGGEAIDVGSNERVDFLFVSGATGGYSFSWDRANQKLIAYYNDYDAGADGAHIQVPNTTDLSSLTAVAFLALGQ